MTWTFLTLPAGIRPDILERVVPLLIAVLLDALLGDPPNRFHPTAWMGSLISALTRRRPRQNPTAEFAYGALVTLAGAGICAAAGFALAYLCQALPALVRWLAVGAVLKTTFSLRGLERAAGEVQSALEQGQLDEARRLVAWHLVSRDTSKLDAAQVASAAVESVAENASDGVVAPLLCYVLGGLPLALAYRFTNTADTMLGYHDAEHEWLGKFPARLDDLLNLVPARLAGLLITLAAPLSRGSLARAWKVMWRDAHLTASPNAGVPMSAMAGALGVRLEKLGHYCLGAELRNPGSTDLRLSRYNLAWMTVLAILFFLGVICYVPY
jgi:adenosylcobinamide-phosphate synthase